MDKLIVAPSPHVHSSESTTRIMRDVIIALMPALVVSVIVFGWMTLAVTAVSVLSCVLFEYLIQKYLLKGRSTVGDLSAVVTGVLLAFNLPVTIPLWIVVIGALVAIGVGKMTFGGIGKNPFNPALVGRVLLLISFPRAGDLRGLCRRCYRRCIFGRYTAGIHQGGPQKRYPDE